MSIPKRGAQHTACQRRPLAAPESRAVQPVHAPSDAWHVSYNGSRVHAVLETIAGALRGVDRGGAHAGRSVPPQESHSLAWQGVVPQERSASLLLAGRAQGSRVTSGATRALDGDGQSPRHRLSAPWLLADQPCTNSG